MKKSKMKSVKTLIVVLVLSFISVSTYSQNSKMTAQEKKEVKELKKLNADLKSGKITPQEYQEKSKKISADNPAITPYKKMPAWAKEFNAPEVKGFKMIQNKSTVTRKTATYPQGFKVLYSGETDALIKEAKRLVKELGIFGRGDEDTYEATGSVGKNKKYTAIVTVVTHKGKSTLEYSITDLSASGVNNIDAKALAEDLFKF